MNRFQECFNEYEAGDNFGAGKLFQGMRYDRAQAHFYTTSQRAFNPKVQAWTDRGAAGYMDGLNVYNAPVDEPIDPVDPLAT